MCLQIVFLLDLFIFGFFCVAFGVFTTRAFHAGDFLLEYRGILCCKEPLDSVQVATFDKWLTENGRLQNWHVGRSSPVSRCKWVRQVWPIRSLLKTTASCHGTSLQCGIVSVLDWHGSLQPLTSCCPPPTDMEASRLALLVTKNRLLSLLWTATHDHRYRGIPLHTWWLVYHTDHPPVCCVGIWMCTPAMCTQASVRHTHVTDATRHHRHDSTCRHTSEPSMHASVSTLLQ